MSTKRAAVVDLGWCVGQLTIDEAGRAESLTICSPASTSERRYAPAESVCIVGREHILALKLFLDESLRARELCTGTEAAP